MYSLCHYFVFLGSPYTLEIVDSSQVTASGEGLSTVEVNKRAMFIVNTHGASGGDVRVTVQSKNLFIPPVVCFTQWVSVFGFLSLFVSLI